MSADNNLAQDEYHLVVSEEITDDGRQVFNCYGRNSDFDGEGLVVIVPLDDYNSLLSDAQQMRDLISADERRLAGR